MPEWWPEKKLGAASAIFDERGWILLVKHSYGRLNWELPGGAVEAGESIVEAAVREAYEETGLRVVAEHTAGVYYDAEVDALHFVLSCRPRDAASTPRPDAAEVTECEYRDPDDLPRPISNFTLRRVEDVVSAATQPLPVTVGRRQWLV